MSPQRIVSSSVMNTSLRSSAEIVPLASGQARILIADAQRAWRDVVMEKLNRLVTLQPGWNGYGAPPVRFENAHFAFRMLEAICESDAPTPQIVPGASGDLQIEWHLRAGDIELHVRAPNNVVCWRETDQTGPDGEELALTIDFTKVANWIKELQRSSSAVSAAA